MRRVSADFHRWYQYNRTFTQQSTYHQDFRT